MVSRNMVLSFPSSVEKLRLEINLLPFAINQLIAELVVREPLAEEENSLIFYSLSFLENNNSFKYSAKRRPKAITIVPDKKSISPLN
jgi:hypothetical protein